MSSLVRQGCSSSARSASDVIVLELGKGGDKGAMGDVVFRFGDARLGGFDKYRKDSAGNANGSPFSEPSLSEEPLERSLKLIFHAKGGYTM